MTVAFLALFYRQLRNTLMARKQLGLSAFVPTRSGAPYECRCAVMRHGWNDGVLAHV